MTDPETRERIDGEAAAWAARHALAELTEAEQAELDAWLAQDRRHAGAYLRAQASYYAMEEAALASPVPTPSNDDEPGERTIQAEEPARLPARIPRRTLGIGLAVAASLAALVFSLPVLRAPSASSAHVTQLADGSSVDFGKGGVIRSAFDGRSRRITLDRGEATFHVAKDRSRPFIVQSGKVYAEATGTVYSVRRVGDNGGAVRVTEGTVRVWSEGARDKAVMLHAGHALTLDPAPARKAPAPAQSFWFEDTSIAEAAARFNAANTTRIVVADPAIGRMTIMGRFKPDRPAEFAKAAAALAGAQVVEREGVLVIQKN